MNIKINSLNRNDVGGASTFQRNFVKAVQPFGVSVCSDGGCDVLFITGASLCDRGTAELAKQEGAKIVLRVDNILEDSKNRNTGMPRIRDFAEMSDVVVYQSEWARKLMKPYAGDGEVIYNAVDTDIFYPRKEKKDWRNIRILYTKHSRNEVKNWHYVQYFWREYNLENKNDTLVLAGQFSDETQRINNPFEFHNGENYVYEGRLDPNQMADVIRSCDVAYLPYSFDACSNTVIECQACGVPVLFEPNGGTPEIVMHGTKYNHLDNPAENVERAMTLRFNFENFKEFWGLKRMGEEYNNLFKKLC